MLRVMATLKEKIWVETQVRELLARNGLPEPDGVEYGYGCIRLFFEEPKTVLIVDIDEPVQDAGKSGTGGYVVDTEDFGDDFAIKPPDGDTEANWN